MSSPDPLTRARAQILRARDFAGRLAEVAYVVTLAVHDLVWRPLYRRY